MNNNNKKWTYFYIFFNKLKFFNVFIQNNKWINNFPNKILSVFFKVFIEIINNYIDYGDITKYSSCMWNKLLIKDKTK